MPRAVQAEAAMLREIPPTRYSPAPPGPKGRPLPVPLRCPKPSQKYPPVADYVEGKKELPEAALLHTLGYAAFELWKALLRRRSWEGFSAATLEHLTEAMPNLGPTKFGTKGNTARRVKQALSRLRKFGLVETLRTKRFVSWWDEEAREQREAFCMVRYIVGYHSPEVKKVILPAAVARNVLEGYVTDDGERKRWGGKRSGSGRKKAAPSPSTANQDQYPDLKNAESRSVPHVTDLSVSESDAVTSVPSASSLREEAREHAPAAQVVSSSSGGTRIGGGRPGRLTPIAFPAELSFASLKPAAVPSPPKLKEDASEEDTLLTMIRAYRGACESRFGRSNFGMGNRAVTKAQQEKLLTTAAALREHDISPFAWAAFSCDVWRAHNKGPPRLEWVFLASRVEERAGWFKSELSDYSGQRVVFGPKAKALLTDHETMRMYLMQARTEEERVAIEARFFPGDSFAQRVKEAKAEGEAERTRLSAALEKGHWLWN